MALQTFNIEEACCKQCGYRLQGLEANRCPECGREFDPNDPTTVRLPGQRRRIRIRLRPRTLKEQVIVIALVAVGASNLPKITGHAWIWALYSTMVCLVSIIVLYVPKLRPQSAEADFVSVVDRLPTGVLGICLIALTCYVSSAAIARWDCPHAKYVFVGPVGVAYSVSGGPCRNPPLTGGMHLCGNYYLAFKDVGI